VQEPAPVHCLCFPTFGRLRAGREGCLDGDRAVCGEGRYVTGGRIAYPLISYFVSRMPVLALPRPLASAASSRCVELLRSRPSGLHGKYKSLVYCSLTVLLCSQTTFPSSIVGPSLVTAAGISWQGRARHGR